MVAAISVIVVVLSWVAVDREIQRSKVVGIWTAKHHDWHRRSLSLTGSYLPSGNIGVSADYWTSGAGLGLGDSVSAPGLVFKQDGTCSPIGSSAIFSYGINRTWNLDWRNGHHEIVLSSDWFVVPWHARIINRIRRFVGLAPPTALPFGIASRTARLPIREINGVAAIQVSLWDGAQVLLFREGDDASGLDGAEAIRQFSKHR